MPCARRQPAPWEAALWGLLLSLLPVASAWASEGSSEGSEPMEEHVLLMFTAGTGGVSGGRLPDLQPPAGNPARGIALGLLAALPLWGVIVFVGRLVARGV